MTYVWAACTFWLQLPRKQYVAWAKWTCRIISPRELQCKNIIVQIVYGVTISYINKLSGVSSTNVCKRLFGILLTCLFLNLCHGLVTVWWYHAYKLTGPRCLWEVTVWMLVIGKMFRREFNTSICRVFCKACKITASCFFSYLGANNFLRVSFLCFRDKKNEYIMKLKKIVGHEAGDQKWQIQIWII
jgi:hypothetical protein